jgi:hypothetical protein
MDFDEEYTEKKKYKQRKMKKAIKFVLQPVI